MVFFIGMGCLIEFKEINKKVEPKKSLTIKSRCNKIPNQAVTKHFLAKCISFLFLILFSCYFRLLKSACLLKITHNKCTFGTAFFLKFFLKPLELLHNSYICVNIRLFLVISIRYQMEKT